MCLIGCRSATIVRCFGGADGLAVCVGERSSPDATEAPCQLSHKPARALPFAPPQSPHPEKCGLTPRPSPIELKPDPMKFACLLFAAALFATVAEPGDPGEAFELRVRPVLAAKCYTCHTDAKSGGLQLDTREHLLAGGKSGPAIKPGDPDNSLLVQALRQTHPRLKMPPGGKLPAAEIDAIAEWVKAGAPWPTGAAQHQIRPLHHHARTA